MKPRKKKSPHGSNPIPPIGVEALAGEHGASLDPAKAFNPQRGGLAASADDRAELPERART
jgi:hypothetical protein